jgi:mRNA interferase YafQ
MSSLKAAVKAVAAQDTDWLKQHRDHQRTGNLPSYPELHIQGDWLLIYAIDDGVLVFTRTGSHDELL